jgi:hypothetical protein
MTITALADGEIDMAIYCYCELETQDLVGYNIELPREKSEQLLAYLWLCLKKTDPERC